MPAAGRAAKIGAIPLGAKTAELGHVEVTGVERQQRQPDEHEDDDEQLPPHEDVVELGEELHTEHVDDTEDRDHRDGHEDARHGEDEDALFRLHQPRHIARGVLHGREHLDADGSRRRQPRDPPAGVAGERTERIMRVAHDTAGDREHDTELGVVQSHEDDKDRTQGPRQDRGRAGHARSIEGAEEPTGADDRPDSGEEQTGLADIALEPFVVDDGHARGRAR